jgi:maltose O-acetyltransferase
MANPAEQSLIVSPVVMEANTALGLNSVMLPGATIQEGSWVGTNSMVLKSIPPFSIASGAPAHVISERKK